MRPKFQTRQILLRGQQQVDTLLFLIPNLPLDAENPLEVLIREPVKQRGIDQNGLYYIEHSFGMKGTYVVHILLDGNYIVTYEVEVK